MNSLLGNLGNSLLGSSSPVMANNMPSILLQAVGAALRNESPQEFMQRLAN